MTRVYVGRLSCDCRERDIESFLRNYGKINNILLKNGYGFVEFDDYRDAEDAVFELNGKEFLGERVILELARGPSRQNNRFGGPRRRGGNWMDKSSHSNRYGPPTHTRYRLIVENLSSRSSWQDLKDYMRQAGDVTFADAHKQRRNEGVVDFASYSDLKNAIKKLDGTELNGRKIRLVEQGSRYANRSRSRSSSRSRSRSRSRSGRRSKSGGRSRSRSRSAEKLVSKSPARDSDKHRDRSRSLSYSPKKSPNRSRSPSYSPKKSPNRSRSPSYSPKKSPNRSRSVSYSPKPSPGRRSDSDANED